MKLKIKYPNESKVITLSSQEPNLRDLFQFINEHGIDVEEIKVGFPPKSISLSDENQTLQKLGISNNDQIIVIPNKDGRAKPKIDPISKPNKPSKNENKSGHSDEPKSHSLSVDYDSSRNLGFFEIPDDNSCLFRAVEFSLLRSWVSFPNLREVVANVIESNPDVYTDAILGKRRKDYIEWILKPNSWGGAIELQILAEYFDVTIWSLDVSSTRIDQFNPGQLNYIVLIYSGIHYDSVALISSSTLVTTVFEAGLYKSEMKKKVLELGTLLKSSHYYTNTADFTLKCNNCGTALVGEKEALAHAKLTGHSNFGEY